METPGRRVVVVIAAACLAGCELGNPLQIFSPPEDVRVVYDIGTRVDAPPVAIDVTGSEEDAGADVVTEDDAPEPDADDVVDADADDVVDVVDAGAPDVVIVMDVPVVRDVPPMMDVQTPRDVPPVMDVQTPRDVPPAMDVQAPRDIPPPMDVQAPRDVPPPMDVQAPRDVPMVCPADRANCDGESNNGCEVDLLTSPASCGACGVACPSGACVGGRCAQFGGAFQTRNPARCTACGSTTASAMGCACPMGSTRVQLSATSDCAGGGSRVTGALNLCTWVGAPVDWGGAYEQDDPAPAPCGTGCRARNPFTNACSCPAGTTPVSYRVQVASTDCIGERLGAQVVICHAPAAGPRFGGAYQVDDPSMCRVRNPYTSGCSCPSGYAPLALRVEIPLATSWTGSQLVVCAR